ncbi:MAG: hypothetical protein LBU81_07770 [Methanosarcinales archaeon]|jgi:hypothetical protein|nr:hypothetical protein [Methanosarcinales archaeon]
MTENVFITFALGLKQLKEHPVLFVPGILYYIVVFFFALVFNFMIRLDLTGNSGFSFNPVFSVSFIAAVLMLSSFTAAGSIGMSKEIVKNGKTTFRHLFSYGKKFGLRLALATVFITLLRSFVAFFWAPVLRLFNNSEYTAEYVIDTLKTDPSLLLPLIETLSAPVLIMVFASAVYLLLVSFMFYFVSYIIVIDDMKIFKSYRLSFKLLNRRPIRISAFVFLVTAVEMLAVFINALAAAVFSFINLPFFFSFSIYAVVSLFFTTAMYLWVTRFYMVLTGIERVRTSL